MKILFQTNNRLNHQLKHEYKKLLESGHEIIPFGYYQTTLESSKKQIVLTGLENVDLDIDQHYMRCGIKLMTCSVLDNIILDQRPFETVGYSDDGFSTYNIPENICFLNKSPQKYAFTSMFNICDTVFDRDVFIKPVNDLKEFTAFILNQGNTVKEQFKDCPDFLRDTALSSVHLSTNVHSITEEVRCYVVGRKVVTISRYRYNDQFNTDPIPLLFKQQYISYAQDIVDNIYAPADNFTIDLCEISGKILVMEYNCLTTSGLYECDSKVLFDALEKYYYST